MKIQNIFMYLFAMPQRPVCTNLNQIVAVTEKYKKKKKSGSAGKGWLQQAEHP